MPLETLVGLASRLQRRLPAFLEASVKRAFGTVEVPWWMLFSVHSNEDARGRRVLVVFQLTLKEHKRILDLDPGLGLRRLVELPERRKYFVEVPINFESLEREDDVWSLFDLGFETFLRSLSRRLYEFDPRAGWSASSRGSLPTLPALDPSAPFSRTGLPAETVSASVPSHIAWPRCSFCNRAHAPSDPPVWAGGNLLWVHPACWSSRS